MLVFLKVAKAAGLTDSFEIELMEYFHEHMVPTIVSLQGNTTYSVNQVPQLGVQTLDEMGMEIRSVVKGLNCVRLVQNQPHYNY